MEDILPECSCKIHVSSCPPSQTQSSLMPLLYCTEKNEFRSELKAALSNPWGV